MSFEINTLYFDDVTTLTHAWREHTVGREVTWTGGAYAKVYDLGDKVMKLSDGDDMGYLSYLETMAELDIKNPYLPIIYSSTYYRLTDEARRECHMYKVHEKIVTYMERLEQPPKYKRNVWDKNENLLKSSKPPVCYWMQAMSEYVYMDMSKLTHLSLNHQELIVLLKIAHEHFKTKYPKDFGRYDLHAGNVLARGRQFVITDPLA